MNCNERRKSLEFIHAFHFTDFRLILWTDIKSHPQFHSCFWESSIYLMSNFLSSLSFDTSKKQADVLCEFISPCIIHIPLIHPTYILTIQPHITAKDSNTFKDYHTWRMVTSPGELAIHFAYFNFYICDVRYLQHFIWWGISVIS